MNYSEIFTGRSAAIIKAFTEQDVDKVLQKSHRTAADLPALLSDAASKKLSRLAQFSQAETRQRFGANLQLFLPLYLSNLCTNICTYCGFSSDAKIKRTWLRDSQIETELKAIQAKGIEHILLVTGEAEHKIHLEYFVNALKKIRPEFTHVQLEAQPLNKEEYAELNVHGLDGVVVYQETYNQKRYSEVHLKGKKQNFNYRLDTADRVAQAGIEKIGLGILLGLSDWQSDALALGEHLNYLQNRYWRHRFSVGFPRLRPCASNFNPPNPVTDLQLIQLITAFRLCFHDVEIVLSTREPQHFRDALLLSGVTHLSAESSTQPGGYSESSESHLRQFDINDKRSVNTISEAIRKHGYNPLTADNIPVSIKR